MVGISFALAVTAAILFKNRNRKGTKRTITRQLTAVTLVDKECLGDLGMSVAERPGANTPSVNGNALAKPSHQTVHTQQKSPPVYIKIHEVSATVTHLGLGREKDMPPEDEPVYDCIKGIAELEKPYSRMKRPGLESQRYSGEKQAQHYRERAERVNSPLYSLRHPMPSVREEGGDRNEQRMAGKEDRGPLHSISKCTIVTRLSES
eukprot:scpid79020/ scgid14398/ 